MKGVESMSRAILFFLIPAATAVGAVEFNRDIRPVLTTHCTACHGGVKTAGGVSFVYREKALAAGKSGKRTIVPGRPEESEMMRRVTSDDEDEVMPKPEHGPRLGAAEVAVLRQWIAEGAPLSEHWSVVRPVDPEVPVVKRGDWVREPMDAFVLARLEAEGMGPAGAAGDAEWLRRVSLDLTGLPPSVEEWAAFSGDAGSEMERRGRVVDRLLASPSYGERWASLWLDLARYADTYGFEKDPYREIWPWRDWVIRAFNADMRFSEFTIRQLAGDLLDNATADDLLATAFHRNTQNNSEGGTDDEEWRTTAVHDRVNTTWTVWQATTFGCVQCHSHPYDPYPHTDYYQFKAFFDSTEDCDQNDDWPRFAWQGDAAAAERAARAYGEMGRLRERIGESGRAAVLAAEPWRGIGVTTAAASGGVLTVRDGGEVVASGTMPVGVGYTVSLSGVEGMTAIRLRVRPESDEPKDWPERGCMVTDFKVSVVGADGKKEPMGVREVVADQLAGPFDPLGLVRGGERAGFGGYPVLEGPRWCVFVLAGPVPAGSSLEVVMKHGAPVNSGFQGTPTRRFSFEGTTAVVAEGGRGELLAVLEKERGEYRKSGGTAVPVMRERVDAPRDTRLYLRGNRLTKGERTEPGIPGVFGAVGGGGRQTRLDMAKWLVSEANPLTARVMANRLWAALFGRGIVETEEDFGSSGSLPSHQALLDHLAVRLVKVHGWSLKGMLREMVLSGTYGQTSRVKAEVVARDPRNVLWSRGPRVRLTAEMVRDQALALSGLLSAKQFGPPVYPPQPDGVWSTVYSGDAWRTSQGEDRYRRAVYTYVKRTSGYPGFLSFDAPSRDLCTARRMPTNTPLQALVTLNDPAYVEMAVALAKRAGKEGGTVRERVARAVRLITLEEPAVETVETLVKLYDGAVKEYGTEPELAKLLGGDAEAAALTLVMNTLLNTDFALNR
jgi:hypothetical protein